MAVPLPIIDPHFHVWNTHTHPNPTLGELGERLPIYSLLDYERDAGVGLAGYVHIETVVGQAEGGERGLDPVDETRNVLQQAAAEGRERQIRIVAFVKLSQMPEAEAVLSAHRAVAGDKLVGVRMILNHSETDPDLTWPQVERGDFLTGGVPAFKEGFALLAKHGGLSFDLQCNWFQLEGAAAFLAEFPDTPVVVDHLGCLKLTGSHDEVEDAKRVAEWRNGMAALAALPQVHVKLSMLEYVRQGWMDPASAAHGVVKGLVRETIDLFGPGRCMFASNFPVDKLLASPSLDSLEGLVAAQHSLVADLEEEDRRALFHDTAARVYKFVAPPLAAPASPATPAAPTTTPVAGQEQEQGEGPTASVAAMEAPAEGKEEAAAAAEAEATV